MDRRRRRPAKELTGPLTAGLLVLAAGGALAAPHTAPLGDAPIRGLEWVARTSDPARALGSVPTECLKAP
ncbi:MAG: hypothetical protein ACXWK0_08920, partial [Caulobacteraceae bacterium]